VCLLDRARLQCTAYGRTACCKSPAPSGSGSCVCFGAGRASRRVLKMLIRLQMNNTRSRLPKTLCIRAPVQLLPRGCTLRDACTCDRARTLAAGQAPFYPFASMYHAMWRYALYQMHSRMRRHTCAHAIRSRRAARGRCCLNAPPTPSRRGRRSSRTPGRVLITFSPPAPARGQAASVSTRFSNPSQLHQTSTEPLRGPTRAFSRRRAVPSQSPLRAAYAACHLDPSTHPLGPSGVPALAIRRHQGGGSADSEHLCWLLSTD
jgi:hypothetical protein